MGRHQHRFAGLCAHRFAGNYNFGLAFQYVHQRIEGGRMLAQPLAFSEREQRYGSHWPFHNCAAHDGARLIVHKVRQGNGLCGRNFSTAP